MPFSIGGFLSGAGHVLGGIVKTATRAAIDVVPGGGTALSLYDQYNTSRGRVGAFSPAGATPAPMSGGGVIKTGGGAPPGGGPGLPPALPSMVGGAAAPPGTAIARIPQGNVSPEAAYLQGRVAARPRGHMTKGTRRNPPHWTNRRRPRMNPMNVHAARRSVRRLVAGEKLFRKIFRIMHHHKAAVAVKRSRK